MKMGRPKRKRHDQRERQEVDDNNVESTGTSTGQEAKGSSSGGGSSKSRRKRARQKKKQLQKAKRKRQEKKQREKAAKDCIQGSFDESGEKEQTSSTANPTFEFCHRWIDNNGTPSKVIVGPRDCYGQRHDAAEKVLAVSWLNELRWYQCGSSLENKIAASSCPTDLLPQLENNEHVECLVNQLTIIKNRMWPAALRCAAAHNANNFDQRTADDEFVESRRACNRFEFLGEGQRGGLNTMFVNRSAMKLASIDALLEFDLVPPRNTSKNDPFVFVDLCGAPGGFSEYIMYRCKSKGIPCKGMGMSLSGNNENGHGVEWKLGHIDTSESTHFQVYTGVDDTGDIYNWENIDSLSKTIVTGTSHQQQRNDPAKIVDSDRRVVDLVVADGGFDAQRDSSSQEQLTQKIVVCQAAAALRLLKCGGKFIMKMFGHQTREIKVLLEYLASHCFDKITVLKPVTSRPASGESYLVCLGFRGVHSLRVGKAWIDRILLSSKCLCPQTTAQQDAAPCVLSFELCDYLDTVDADIARLNVKACSAILSHLEAKAAKMESGGLDNEEAEEDFVEETTMKAVVDMLAYKHVFKLKC